MIIFSKNGLRRALSIYMYTKKRYMEMMTIAGQDSVSELRLEQFKMAVESPPACIYHLYISLPFF